MKFIQDEFKVVLARNEINYKFPAKFDQLLKVYIRVRKVNNSSFIFEEMIEDVRNGFFVAEYWAYHVCPEWNNDEPMTAPEHVRKAI